jgi:hypothetical protein
MIDPDVFFSMNNPTNSHCHIIHSKQGFRDPDGPEDPSFKTLYGWNYNQWVTENIGSAIIPDFRCNYVYMRCTNPSCSFKGDDGGPGPDDISNKWVKWNKSTWFNNPPTSCSTINLTSICGTSMLEHVYVVPKAFTSIQIKTYTGNPDLIDSDNYDNYPSHPSQKFSLRKVTIPENTPDLKYPDLLPENWALLDDNLFRQACLVRYLREAAS